MSGSIAGRWAGLGKHFRDAVPWEAFHPAQFTEPFPQAESLVIDLHPRDLVGLLEDGDSVSGWPNRVVDEDDATQATGSKQPTYHCNEDTGFRPMVRFDGSSFLSIDSVASHFSGTDLPACVLAIFQWRPEDTHETLFALANSADADPIWLFKTSDSQCEDRPASFKRDDGDNSATVCGISTWSEDGLETVAWNGSGTAVDIWKAGRRTVNGGPQDLASLTLDMASIGALSFAGGEVDHCDGDLYRLLVWSENLTDSELGDAARAAIIDSPGTWSRSIP